MRRSLEGALAKSATIAATFKKSFDVYRALSGNTDQNDYSHHSTLWRGCDRGCPKVKPSCNLRWFCAPFLDDAPIHVD